MMTTTFDAGRGGLGVPVNGVSGATGADTGTGTGEYHPTHRGSAPPN